MPPLSLLSLIINSTYLKMHFLKSHETQHLQMFSSITKDNHEGNMPAAQTQWWRPKSLMSYPIRFHLYTVWVCVQTDFSIFSPPKQKTNFNTDLENVGCMNKVPDYNTEYHVLYFHQLSNKREVMRNEVSPLTEREYFCSLFVFLHHVILSKEN